MARVAVFGGLPASLINFRGPLLVEIVAAGHDTHAIGPPADRAVIDALTRFGVRYHAIPLRRGGVNPLYDLYSLLALYRLLRRLRPDCLLSYTIKPVIYGSLAARLAGVSRVYSMITGLGYAFSDVNLRSRIVGWVARVLYRRALRKNTRIFFQSTENLDAFRRLRLLRSEGQPLLIRGSGVDLAHYVPKPYPDTLSFLMISRLLKNKGVREYVTAARTMHRRFPAVRCRLVGWIDNENPEPIGQVELDSWIHEGVVEYLGRLSDVRPAIAASSVFVLPSSYPEGLPRTLLEAMAMARALITTDVAGCRDLVVEGSNGYLVPIKDADALVAAMTRFVDNPRKVEAMGAESRRLVEQSFDVHTVNHVILTAMGLNRENIAPSDRRH